MPHTAHSKTVLNRRGSFTAVVKLAMRAVIAVTLLLTLVGGNLILTATASNDLCTLACCAGRAPHAAGSCMQGSCAPNHAHHDQTSTVHDDDTVLPAAFAGVTAGAHGTDMNEVPTVDASVDNSSVKLEHSNTSAATLSKPCLPDCGACNSTFNSSKRPRNVAARSGRYSVRRPRSLRIVREDQPIISSSRGLADDSNPRGPPSFV